MESRVVRLLVLLLAFGVGGVAGAPSMALPPRLRRLYRRPRLSLKLRPERHRSAAAA